MSAFLLARTKRCEKCPWKVSTDPYDIPNGYCPELHRDLGNTIAAPGSLRIEPMMSCHEHPPGKEVPCLGWLANQLGLGHNIRLRLQMLQCENIGDVKLDGDQHRCFDDTLSDGEVVRTGLAHGRGHDLDDPEGERHLRHLVEHLPDGGVQHARGTPTLGAGGGTRCCCAGWYPLARTLGIPNVVSTPTRARRQQLTRGAARPASDPVRRHPRPAAVDRAPVAVLPLVAVAL